MTVTDSAEFEEQKAKVLKYRTGNYRDIRETPSTRRSRNAHKIALVGKSKSGMTSFLNLISSATSESSDEIYRPRSYVAQPSGGPGTLLTETFKITESVYFEDRPGFPPHSSDYVLTSYLHAAPNGDPWIETDRPQKRNPVALPGVNSSDISLIAFCVSGTDLVPHLSKTSPDDSAEIAENTMHWKQAQQIMSREHNGLPFVFIVTMVDVLAEKIQQTEEEAARLARDKLCSIVGCPSNAVIVIRSYPDQYQASRDKELELQGLRALERLLFWCDSYIRFEEPAPFLRIGERLLALFSNSRPFGAPNNSNASRHHQHNRIIHRPSLGQLLRNEICLALLIFILVAGVAFTLGSLFANRAHPSVGISPGSPTTMASQASTITQQMCSSWFPYFWSCPTQGK